MTDAGMILTLDLLGYRARVTAPDGEMLTQVAAIFDDLRVPDDEPVDATRFPSMMSASTPVRSARIC